MPYCFFKHKKKFMNRIKYFQKIDDRLWNDWKWQISNYLSTYDDFNKITDLSSSEKFALKKINNFGVSVSPFYSKHLKNESIRKTILPVKDEFINFNDEFIDPLGEEKNRVTPHIIHTYPDKILFLATTFCATYCRYCTRSRIVSKPKFDNANFDDSIEYIKNNKKINDVLISGGDPLIMSDLSLNELLSKIRKISHVKLIRIGSKIPTVLPMRITDELCKILKKYNIWLSLHFIHPDEIQDETIDACKKLSDAGIPMISQTVLLKGVNDHKDTLIELFYSLLKINIKPYYLLQCDPIKGSKHFRTNIKKSIELIRSLHCNISGIAVPQFVIDSPGGGGKIPIISLKQIKQKGNNVIIEGFNGKKYIYPDIMTD